MRDTKTRRHKDATTERLKSTKQRCPQRPGAVSEAGLGTSIVQPKQNLSIPGLLWRPDSPARGTRVGLLRMRKALCRAGAQGGFSALVGGDLSLRLFGFYIGSGARTAVPGTSLVECLRLLVV